MEKRMTSLAIVLATLVAANTASAAVTANEAAALGKSLTPWGAEKAGNKEGTIPEYTGVPAKQPAAYDPGKPGQLPDPYNDKPLFTITTKNYTQYAEKLHGMVELFKKNPEFRMDVYPTRRSFVYPKIFSESSIKNATSCKEEQEKSTPVGCYPGSLFPIPKTGTQVMWNHLTQYEAVSMEGTTEGYVVTARGDAVLQTKAVSEYYLPFHDPNIPGVRQPSTPIFMTNTRDLAPARKVGGAIVVVDLLDQTRRVWQYIPAQRRVKISPNLAYDTPSPFSGGSATMDDQKGFMGAMDRYDWKLVGKTEKFILYNNYKYNNSAACPISKLVSTKLMPNPDCLRWELHRVWVVEAKLKTDTRHVYNKRIFYWDEDAPGGGIAENFDASGALFRIGFVPVTPFYTGDAVGGLAGLGGGWTTDLQTNSYGIYAGQGCMDPDCGYRVSKRHPESNFTPEAMTSQALR